MSVSVQKTGVVLASGDIGANLLATTPKSYSPTAYMGYQIDFSKNMTAGTTYTIQLWDVYVYHSGKTEAQLGIK